MLDKLIIRVPIAGIILVLAATGFCNEHHNYLFKPHSQFELHQIRGIAPDWSMSPKLSMANIDLPITKSLLELQQIGAGQQAKSKGKAFFLSLLLPGLGERYAGSYTKSQIFMGTEILFWAGYVGFNRFNAWRKEDYKAFAATHAGVDLTDKLDSYFTDLEVYDSIYSYNEAKLRDRDLKGYYRDTEEYYWSWDSETNRKAFRDLRISADEAYNRSLFAIAAVVANHIISAIDAMWTVHKYNKNLETSDMGVHIRFDGSQWDPSLSICLCKRF